MSDVKIFTKDNCSQCHASKMLMKDLGIVFDEVNISHDKDALNYLKSMGIRQAPYIETVQEGSWSGFQENRIRALAKNTMMTNDDDWDF